MTDKINRQFLIAAHPDGMLKESDFQYHETGIPVPGEGEVLVKVLMVAVEPALRGVMVADPNNPGALKPGDVMNALAAGEVVSSNNPEVAEGDLVQGLFGFTDYAVTHPNAFLFSKIPDGVPLDAALYVFDTSGLTAYLGMMEIGQPQQGEHVLVSAAAGAVGSLAVQMAKIAGAKVIGIAGTEEKCHWLVNELGLDGAINYHIEDVGARIESLLPGGVDIYFDNVGGEILDAALGQLRMGSRVILCGRISEYANKDEPFEPSNAARVINNCLRMERLVLFNHTDRFNDWRKAMANWMSEGKLHYTVDMLEGFDNLPRGLIRLFTGENKGKQLIRIN